MHVRCMSVWHAFPEPFPLFPAGSRKIPRVRGNGNRYIEDCHGAGTGEGTGNRSRWVCASRSLFPQREPCRLCPFHLLSRVSDSDTSDECPVSDYVTSTGIKPYQNPSHPLKRTFPVRYPDTGIRYAWRSEPAPNPRHRTEPSRSGLGAPPRVTGTAPLRIPVPSVDGNHPRSWHR